MFLILKTILTLGLSLSAFAFSLPWSYDGDWVVEKHSEGSAQKSTVQYEVRHPLHNCEGQSSKLGGVVHCKDLNCEFNLSVPVESFRSRDADKDAEMFKYMRSLEHPNVILQGKVRLLEKTLAVNGLLTVAGITRPVNFIFEFNKTWSSLRLKGDFDWSLDDFNIRRPRLLGMPIEPVVKMYVDITFTR